ncbi:hypothetical protein GGR93_001711 [Sulfitobacter noctilucicola]|uniref:Uncharacterized protein n=1 Tax=Sulfitobacter noctilucicola TaxID=1342301 RepID=A0A7W6M7L2_9RHOB|nr:hypothetical protein [Sulfitobacter noctilucicola]
MSFEDRVTKLNGALEKLRAMRFNALWIAVIVICFLAAYFGYCVEISWSEGFSFSKCVDPRD